MTWHFQRNVGFLYVAFCVCSTSLVFGTSPARSADWPQFRKDPAHTAVAPAASLPPSGRLLVPAWTRRFPEITVDGITRTPAVNSSPAIASGVVYVGSRNTHLYALSAETGAILWEYAAGREIESSPLVKDGAVCFVPYIGTLTALNATDGSVRWTHASGGSQDRSSPNISGENVICATGFPKKDIYAVPLASTDPAPRAWTFSTGYDSATSQYDPQFGQFVYSSPAVDPTTQAIYTASDDGRLYALKPDGTPLWDKPFTTVGGVFRASPSVANGKVYLCAGDYDWALHAVDAATGQPVWDAAMEPVPLLDSNYYRAIQVSSPAVDGDFVSVVGGYGSSLGSSILYAFRDKGTAAETLWTTPLPNGTTEGYVSSPALTPTDVIVGVAAKTDAAHPNYPRGRVYSVDRGTGAPTWYATGDVSNIGGPVYSSPAVADDLVVVGDNSGLVTAYRLAKPGDVDADGRVTALDALRMMAPAATDGQAPPDMRYRGDIYPANTVPPDGARSFGDGLITPTDADLVLQHALGMRPQLP